MKLHLAVLIVCCVPLLGVCAPGAPPVSGVITARSSSGQFVVFGNPAPPTQPAKTPRAPGINFVQLDPALVAVSCERVKHALLMQLGARDHWRGKFYIVLHPTYSHEQLVQVTPAKAANGWLYRVDMPNVVEADRFIRTMVRLLLVERINRYNPGDLADAPSWLTEGLVEQILACTTVELLVRPATAQPFGLPTSTLVRHTWLTNYLAAAHEFMRQYRPLDIQQLVAPAPATLIGEPALAFRYSAQLLLCELMQLRNGRVCLGRFIDGLAAMPDAQTALLGAFAEHFRDRRDLEMWWELETHHFITRDLAGRVWQPEEAFSKLDEILQVPALTRPDTDSPATRSRMPIQSLLHQTGQRWQKDLLRLKSAQLQALQFRVPPELATLVAEYRKVLQTLAAAPDSANATARTRKAQLTERAVRQLDALDTQRALLRQKLIAQANRPGRTPP